MRAAAALREGLRRVNRAPVVFAGMFAATLLVALPLSFVVRGTIAADLGDSLAAETAASGTNYDWWQEFSARASGLGTTFVPSIIGFGAVLDNLGNLLDNAPMGAPVAGAIAVWMVVWSFLSGGVLDRYARGRPTRAAGFFGACGAHFWRFLRLGVVAFATYYVLFGWVHGWLFDELYERLTRNLTVERTAFAIRLGCYLLFGALLVAVNLVLDYARARIVVEDRRSALGALVAAGRFVRRHPGALRLYLLNGGLFLVLIAAYALAAPGAAGPGWSMLLALAAGELYILARHYLKLLAYASQVVFFQGALAHADYTAAPALVWPDSPAAESIGNSSEL
ncbi:MAG TPA: hypothetical protein VLD67_01140 [Vicinamibacterales bacterium]|nr:hypothetical protein [Vicinamibacterales bacterium]